MQEEKKNRTQKINKQQKSETKTNDAKKETNTQNK